jgi:ankyrin repeat protein
MKKIASLCAILAISANSYAQETDYSEGIVDYGYKKQILQTSDPFLNKFYNIKEEKYEEEIEMSDADKEKIMLKQAGYDFKESDYIKAIEDGDKVSVLRFIFSGMPVNRLTTFDNTPLFYAMRGRQTGVFELLISKGADIDYVNNRSQNLLLLAIEQGYDDMIPFLITKTNINLMFIDHNAWSAMHYAVEKRDVKTVLLLKQKAPGLLNYKNKFGNTPLLLAMDKANKSKDKKLIALARLLLKDEKYLNISNAIGNTVLHFSTMLNNYDLTKYILQLGANPNLKNAKGWRPIDIALRSNDYELANLLRYYGAEL